MVEPPVRHVIGGRALRFAQPITLTPYASARPCSARCVFCSETLVRRDAVAQAAALRPGAGWREGLRRVLDALAGLRIGVSISGLEATDDAAWLEGVLAAFEEHEARADARGLLGEKVLYTNAAGLVDAAPRLARFGLTRAEVSRHHADARANDAIMRFRAGVAVRDGEAFADAVSAARAHVAVRLVCVVQARGVETIDDVERYLAFARELGVRDVVFRELARLDEPAFVPNRTLRLVQSGRVSIEELLVSMPRAGFEPIETTDGYYYWNVRFMWRGDTLVTFEASDYPTMNARHRSGTIHKLVYHGNQNLCGGWDPGSDILLSARE